MTKLRVVALSALTIVVLSVFATASLAGDDNGDRRFNARLTGFNEVPAWITAASGSFNSRLEGNELHYTLRYTVPPEDGSVIAAHIHIGQRNVAGPVVAFLCGGGGKPACPAQSGTVTETITPSDVIGVQGVDAGSMRELLIALRRGVAYVNVHSTTAMGGLIRGQLR